MGAIEFGECCVRKQGEGSKRQGAATFREARVESPGAGFGAYCGWERA